MVPGIKKPVVRVDRANWKIFLGLPSALPTLNGDGLPSVPYKCAITVTSIAGHNGCTGTLRIGTETKIFNVLSQRLTTTKLLTALPEIASSNLDCQILIEAINSGSAPIFKETLTNILIGYNLRQRLAADPGGNFTIKEMLTKTTDVGCVAGGMIRVDGIDYTIFDSNPKYKPGGREYMRKLVLRQ